jgi:hypothetical protein
MIFQEFSIDVIGNSVIFLFGKEYNEIKIREYREIIFITL